MPITNKKGFSFIELILTLSVLSVVMITAFPSDNGLTPFALDAGARKVKTDIRYAQNMATTTGDTYGFRVTGASTYEIYDATTGAIALSPYTNIAMQENLVTDFGAIVFQNPLYKVEFNAYGQPTLGGGTTLQLNYGGQTKNIQVSATSGYVTLF